LPPKTGEVCSSRGFINNFKVRNRKHVTCFYGVIEHKWNFGRTRKAVGTGADR